MQRQRVLSLVGRLRGTGGKGDTHPIPERNGERVVIEPFIYQGRLRSLQNNAGNIITHAIAQTPERYEDSIRRGLTTELGNNGLPRNQAIDFFSTYVAPVLAEYADILEERREYIINTTLRSARANSFYRGVMMTIEATARQVKGDKSWSIETRVNDFVTQERWEKRYVPILRKYMD